MKTITLSTEEIDGLKRFIERAKEVLMLECVYILPYYSKKEGSAKVSVIGTTNITNFYDDLLLTGGMDIRNTKEEVENLRLITDEFNKEFKDGRLSFEIRNGDVYSLSLMHRREILAELSLLSGTILYDRFNGMTNNRNHVSKYIEPYKDILTITNEEELMAGLTKGEEPNL